MFLSFSNCDVSKCFGMINLFQMECNWIKFRSNAFVVVFRILFRSDAVADQQIEKILLLYLFPIEWFSPGTINKRFVRNWIQFWLRASHPIRILIRIWEIFFFLNILKRQNLRYLPKKAFASERSLKFLTVQIG